MAPPISSVCGADDVRMPENDRKQSQQQQQHQQQQQLQQQQQHQQQEQQQQQQQFICLYCCDRPFSTKGNLSRHIQETHFCGEKFPCPFCGREFTRKEDRKTHVRVHTGEKPYGCKHLSCEKRFARVSDLRSHERIHSGGEDPFVCTHPGCGKTFTRPYDLKKHGLTQHQQRSPKEQGGRAAGTTNPCRAKRPIAEVSTPEFPPPAPRKSQMLSRTESLPPRKGQAPLTVVSLPTSLASLPPPHAPPKPAAHFDVQYRKRVRCEAHKQCDPVHVIGANLDEATVSGKEERVNDSRVSGSGVGGSESQPYRGGTGGATNAAGAGDTKVHIHGASCGHVAILHENHVDFLMEGGKLECYNGKEKSPEGWVSATKEGSCDRSCSCDGAAGADTGGSASTTYVDVHWDGARPDQARGQCAGDSHGPECGHDIIHHEGHLDYIVNGRLIHPLGPPDCARGDGGAAFEDHGSIRALDDDFVSFFETLDALSEKADEAVASFCDMCDNVTCTGNISHL